MAWDQARYYLAVDLHDRAVTVYDCLVHTEGRGELAGDLAKALANKALVLLGTQQQWQEGLTSFEVAIDWWERGVQAGMTHLLPDMLRAIRLCTGLLLAHRQWAAAAANVARALTHTLPALQNGTLPAEPLLQEIGSLLGLLRDLTATERAQVLSHLGPWAEMVQQFLSAP